MPAPAASPAIGCRRHRLARWPRPGRPAASRSDRATARSPVAPNGVGTSTRSCSLRRNRRSAVATSLLPVAGPRRTKIAPVAVRQLRQGDPQRLVRRGGRAAALHPHAHDVVAGGQRLVTASAARKVRAPGTIFACAAPVSRRWRWSASGRRRRRPSTRRPSRARRPPTPRRCCPASSRRRPAAESAAAARIPRAARSAASTARASAAAATASGSPGGAALDDWPASALRFGGRQVAASRPHLHAGPLHPHRDRVELAIELAGRVVAEQVVRRQIGDDALQARRRGCCC